MNTTPHPRAQLSAYLDGALSTAERAAVDAHLATCPDCRARLAELRATASLIRALPDITPSRRLVPRVAAAPAWLAPLRTLSTLASGVSVFLFLASALLANVGQFGATAPAAAPALDRSRSETSASGAGGIPGAAGPAAGQTRGAATGAPALAPSAAPAPATTSLADAAKQVGSPTPSAAAFSVASPVPQTGVNAYDTHAIERSTPSLGTPWLWLGIAVLTGALAIALQRRLRSA